MGKKCTVCKHDKRAEIEVGLAQRTNTRVLADRFGLSQRAIVHHARNCLSQAKRPAQKEASDATGKVKLLSLDSLDGRTAIARKARALIGALESDLGGPDQLTAAEREIVQRAAVASAMLEHMEAQWLAGRGIDVDAYAALANMQRRMLATVGLQRRARDVTNGPITEIRHIIVDPKPMPPEWLP